MKMLFAAAFGLLFSIMSGLPARSQVPDKDAAASALCAQMADADNEFGFSLLETLTAAGNLGNLFFSPVSLSQALALVYNGANGETQRGISRCLHIGGMAPEQVNDANRMLLTSLIGPASASASSDGAAEAGGPPRKQPRVRINIANALWANAGVVFDAGYRKRMQQAYRSEISSLNFTDPAAAATINDWTSAHTQGKIAEIVTSPDLSGSDVVLTNAVYFQGAWAHPFSVSATVDGPFTCGDGTVKRLPKMVQAHLLSYGEDAAIQTVALPYGDGRLSLILILPRDPAGLPSLLKGLDGQAWKRWAAGMQPTPVDLTLPRFDVSYQAEMAPALRSLGMDLAFTPAADFQPMGLPGAHMSRVLHKAVLSVNENGTEAAAATVVIISRSLQRRLPSRVTMQVNHPFLCAIRDNVTGAILFMGAIVSPDPGSPPKA